MNYEPVSMEAEAAAQAVLTASFNVHKELGPGLLESVYEECLCYELTQTGIPFSRQVDFPIKYKGSELKSNFRIDVLVSNTLVVELKSVDNILPIHKAQLLTYLKLMDIRLGLLINFNVPLLKEGIQRIIL